MRRLLTIALLALLGGCGDFGQPFGGTGGGIEGARREYQFRNSARAKTSVHRPAPANRGGGVGGKVWDVPCDPNIMPKQRECKE